MESSTAPGSRNSAASIFPATYSAGPASDLQLIRNGHAFNMFNEYQDISKGFDSLLGFFQTSNIRSDHLHATYQWFPDPKKSRIQSFGLEANQNLAFDHADNRVYHYSTFDPFVLLPRSIVLAPLGGQNSDTVGPQDGYPSLENFTENFGGFVVRGQPWSLLNFNLVGIRGGNVNYNPLAGLNPSLMNQETLQALISVNPLRQLTDDNTYLLDRDHAVSNGEPVYETQTFRTKLNYQFTRAWSARVIVEYDTTLANPAQTTLARTKQIQTQGLLTWLPHPGTVVYLGWNNDLQNYSHTLCTPPTNGAPHACNPNEPILPRAPGYLNDGRQIFVKASYLFRF